MKPDIFFDEATHEYLVDGVLTPSVTEILKPLTNRSFSAINPSVLEYARNRGTAVHEALEVYDLGGELEVVPETEGYIRAYLDWCQVYKPKWEGIEQIVYCKEDGYIGTLDRLGTLNGHDRVLVDIKTSYPSKEALVAVCLQTSAYKIALSETDTGREPKRYGLFLKPDGTWRFLDCFEYANKRGFSSTHAWRTLLNTHKLVTELLETGGKK